jgi:hypothetical protein
LRFLLTLYSIQAIRACERGLGRSRKALKIGN